MKEYAFGIDLGGTTAKIGLFTTAGALLEKWEVPTDTSNAGEHILENLAAAIMGKMQEKAIPAEQVEGVGIGVPGPVLDSSVVPIVCANLGGWGQRNVAAQLSGLLDGLKVLVGNDANVAALGEIWMGAAKGCRSAVMVTLGTGVGGGVIVNGKVIDGSHGAGGEIGHITVNRHETATCGCGKHGCLEQYSSATGVVRCMKKLLDENPDIPCTLRGINFAAKDVFDAARSGDALAAREVDEMTDTLGMALASIAATTDPEMFMIGGGVARAGEVLFDPLREHYKTYAFKSCRETPIVAATLGNDAGIYGSVRLIVGEYRPILRLGAQRLGRGPVLRRERAQERRLWCDGDHRGEQLSCKGQGHLAVCNLRDGGIDHHDCGFERVRQLQLWHQQRIEQQ